MTVVGSFRAAEAGMWQMRRPELFERLAYELGGWLLRSGNILRVGWSNDHIRTQIRPSKDHDRPDVEAEYPLGSNADGTRSALAEDCRFLFEHTADYHALRGFLDAAAQHGAQGNWLHLDVSDAMWCGEPGKGMIKWPAVREMVFGGKPLGVNPVVRRHPIDGSELNLRSSYLASLMKSSGKNGVQAVFALGGGKATGTSYDAAQLKVIPIGYSGGAAEVRLRQIYADRSGPAYERLSYLFGAELPATTDQVDADDAVAETLRLLSQLEDFFCCPYQVFVAFAYGRTEKESVEQDGLFNRVQSAIATLQSQFPGQYPGARAIRADWEIMGGHEAIDATLLKLIERSGVILAELTPIGRVSGSVYIELGYAMGKNKKLLLTSDYDTEVPFDIAGRPVHRWRNLDDFEQKVGAALRRLFGAEQGRAG